jgi:hypothetical protein
MILEWPVNGEKLQKYISVKTPVIIGRASDCDIVLQDPCVSSRHHAVVGYENGLLKMRALNTKNPIALNGLFQILCNDTVTLREGDSFVVGRVQMNASSGTRLHVYGEWKTAELKIACPRCGGRAAGTATKCLWCGEELYDEETISSRSMEPPRFVRQKPVMSHETARDDDLTDSDFD